MRKGLIVFSVSTSPEKQREITELQKKRAAAGYPQVGDVLTAVKTGFTYVCKQRKPFPTLREGHVTKGKQYKVIDNLDLVDGHFHLVPDGHGALAHLSPRILKRFFDVDFKEVTL
jgi:hypothetical protein